MRWQAEIAFNSNEQSYQNWTQVPLIQDELDILLGEVDKQHGHTDPATHVTVMRESQMLDFCISAPSLASPGQYYCADASGFFQLVSAHCPDETAEGNPLRCL
jgi:hypothetical protein